MRRSILMTGIVAGLVLALSACGSTSSSPSTKSSNNPAASGSLTIWTDETRVGPIKKIGADFQAKTGVKLDVIQKPTDSIRKDFVAQVPTGQGPDLVIYAHDGVGEFVKNGIVAKIELGDKLKDMNKVAVDAFKHDGQLYGVPYATENIALVRNNKLASSTPATMDELIAAKPAGVKYPILIQQGAEGDAYHLYPIQTSFSAPVFKQASDGSYTGELAMGGQPGANFAAYLKKMAAKGALSGSLTGDTAKQAFLDGKSPYIITGPWWTPDFKKAGLDISVLPIPSAGGQPSAPFVGVQGVYLSSRSKNTLLANQFLDYIATEAVQTKLYELAGRVPANTAAAKKISDPLLKGFSEAGKHGAPMPAIPEMGSVWKFWGTTELSIINGKATDPASAWTQMIKNIQNSIKK